MGMGIVTSDQMTALSNFSRDVMSLRKITPG